MGRLKLGKWEYTEAELDRQLKAAEKRAERADRGEARASKARYDRKTRRVIVDLVGGGRLILQPDNIEGLRGASVNDLAAVKVMPGGSALHWNKLDVGQTVAGLAAGLFGSAAWMSALARKGGSARSEAKASAARANGLKGGRPKKPRTEEANNPDQGWQRSKRPRVPFSRGGRQSSAVLQSAAMDFVQAYDAVRDCIVAIVPTFYRAQSDFPEIIGTGFLVSPEGLVCTCRHVADAVKALPTPPGYDGYGAQALMVREVTHPVGPGFLHIHVDIHAVGDATVFGDTTQYYGPNPPDVSFMVLAVRETPHLGISSEPVREGECLAFAGFPMGTKLLKAPGWLHQFCPSLHSGLVSAVLPHRVAPIPHGFLLHANTQGGASGSPVFRPDGKVVGMVYMVIEEQFSFGGNAQSADKGLTLYNVPTALTGCVSRETIRAVLALAEAEAKTKGLSVRPTLQQHIDSAKLEKITRGKGIFEPWVPSES